MKRDLDAIITQQSTAGENKGSSESRRIARQAPSHLRVYEAQCIFCERSNKYLKGKNTREPLTLCAEQMRKP